MSKPLPIACSLGAADLEKRMADLRALGGDGLVSVSEAPGSAVLTFHPEAEIRERVAAAASAEAECCAFLDFRLEHDGQATVLTITAPNGGAEVLRELVAAFAD
jgi:MerR family transcriptional regulator, copper efflux regulator